MRRSIYYFRNYFSEFFEKQDSRTQRKIEIVFDLIRYEERIPGNFFKRIKGIEGIYEIRIHSAFRHIRIFCFYDKEGQIIIANCMIKKSKRIPQRDLELASIIRREYFNRQS